MANTIDDQVGAGTDDVIQKWHGRGGFSGSRAGTIPLESDSHPDAGTNKRTAVGSVRDPSQPVTGGWGAQSRAGQDQQGSDCVPRLDGNKFDWS